MHEEEEEEVHGVGDVEAAAVVGIRGVGAGDRIAEEEEVQEAHGVRDVDRPVEVDVAATEARRVARRELGRVQPLTVFDNTPQAIRMVVMLDVSGSMRGNLPLLRAGCEQLFKRLLPGDQARVGMFGTDITISPTFTNDPAQLRAALPSDIDPNAPTPLWKSLDEAMNVLKEADARKVLLVLPQSDKMAVRASRNLKNLWTVTAGDMSLVDVLKADTIVAPVATLDLIEKGYSKN